MIGIKLTKEERSAKDRSIPKCRCGNNLSLSRQKEGINLCPPCDERINSNTQLAHSARAVVNHWDEFGPGNGFDETVERLRKALELHTGV